MPARHLLAFCLLAISAHLVAAPTPAVGEAPAGEQGIPPRVALLYHRDADTRIRAIQALLLTRDRGVIDDLIRAHSVESYTPVQNTYREALRQLTGDRGLRGPGEWKAWLNEEVASGKLRQEGFTARLVVPGIADRVRKLLDRPEPEVAGLARRALEKTDPAWAASQVTFDQALRDLYDTLGREYPCFALKGIDWRKVGEELLPRATAVRTPDEFGLLCLELVARLEDSHAFLMEGTAKVPAAPFPRWDPGFACLIGDAGQPVIYHVDRGSPAADAGIQAGMTVLSVNGVAAEKHLDTQMRQARRYSGYSSDRYLRYHAAQWLGRQIERGAAVKLEMQLPDGVTKTLTAPATLGVRYLPRLPVPIPGIRDSGDVSWTQLTNNIGYIYVRRIGADLLPKLDAAVAELQDARGLIVDVRGNSGGGFDAPVAHRNFALTGEPEPGRARFTGPMALLIDARCISAGEGWASWFIARKRARVFGETTAGASARKTVYTLKNGLFRVQYPVKAYTGFLDRPIERRGLEPDVPLRPNARDLAAGRDTVLEAARQFLDGQVRPARQ